MLRGYIKFEKSEEIIDVGVYRYCWFVAHFVMQIFSTFVGLILNTKVTVCGVSGLPVVSLLCRSRSSSFCHCMLCKYVHTNSYKKFSKCKYECKHIKACESCQGAKFRKKHMVAAQVNEKAIRKGT